MGWGDASYMGPYIVFQQLTVSALDGTLQPSTIGEGREELRRVGAYLDQVKEGVAGTPLCPFIEAVHQGGGYWAKLYRVVGNVILDDTRRPITFDDVATELKQAFHYDSKVSGYRKVMDFTKLDIDFIIAAFPDGNTEKFRANLDEARNRIRPSFLAEGLMLSQMHVKHSDPQKTGGFVSEIPLLCCRRMHKQDIVFMTTPEALAAYYKFFPSK